MKTIPFLLIAAAFLCACGVSDNDNISSPEPDQAAEAVCRKISAEEARDIMESADSFILLDVRTEEEYREKRINGAICIPDYALADRAGTELPDKNAVILIYCRSGRRSANAAGELAGMGYTNVYDFGGILDWPYDTVSG